MKLHELSPAPGSTKSKKRLGRGPGSGLGKTAGRGENGQKSRAGYSRRIGFEGGQMPLIRRVPKRGFTNIFRKEYSVINVSQLDTFDGEVTPEALREAGFAHHQRPIKILGDGDLTKALTVHAHKFSKGARTKIEAAGGTCEVIDAPVVEEAATQPKAEKKATEAKAEEAPDEPAAEAADEKAADDGAGEEQDS